MVKKRTLDESTSAPEELDPPVLKKQKKDSSQFCAAAFQQSLATPHFPSPNSPNELYPSLDCDNISVESSAPLPITRNNLERLHKELEEGRPMSALPSKESASDTMSSKSSPNVSDNLAKLSAYGILVCHKATIPADVAALIKSFEEQIQGLGKNTPEKVAEVYQQAYYSKNEDEGISYLAKLLLPRGEIAHKKKGTSLITTKPELNLKETWVPITGSKTIKTYFGSLFRPKPDHAAGYVSASDAERVSVAAPFTGEEEALLNRMKLADQIHFPFFTAQWKSQGGAESHLHARVQGARDGATIINHMNKFFVAAAHNTKPVDTCHFSMTCDMDSVQLYVHWRDISSEGLERYHMELIKRTWLEEPTEVKDYKRVLRNIVHWATTTRLENIRCALVKLRNVNASRLRSTSNSPMKNMPSVTASSPSSSSSRIPPVPAPGLGTLPTFHQLSPPLSIDVGVKKRRMDEG